MKNLIALVSVLGFAACNVDGPVIVSPVMAAPVHELAPAQEEPTVESAAAAGCTDGHTNFDVSTAPTYPVNPARNTFHYVSCPKGDGMACGWYWAPPLSNSASRVYGCTAPNGQQCIAPCAL